jgi:hypothetical protein
MNGRVRDRAHGEEEADDDQEAGDEGAVGESSFGKQPVEDGEQNERDPERLQEPGGERGQIPRDAEIIEVVVVKGHDAAE